MPPPRPTDPQYSGWDGFSQWVLILSAWLLVFVGLAMALPGVWLVALGGSLYYLIAGIFVFLSGVVILMGRDVAGVRLFAFVVLGSIVWAAWEIHGKGWMQSWWVDLAGRVGFLFGLLVVIAVASAIRQRRQPFSDLSGAGAPLLFLATPAVVLGGVTVAGFLLQEERGRVAFAPDPEAVGGATADLAVAAGSGRSAVQRDDGEWTAYGGSNLGPRFSPATQITPANVADLVQVWEFNTGDEPPNDRVSYSFQNTPIKIDDSLYVCSPSNQVIALDPVTGAEQWRFDPEVPPVAMEPLFSATCRAVAYHEAQEAAAAVETPVEPVAEPVEGVETADPVVEGVDEAPEAEAAPEAPVEAPAPVAAECPRRILLATLDSRLIALDADTGLICPGFGEDGTVDLSLGMGNQVAGFSSSTSGPAVVGDTVVVGQQVSDNQRRDAPSGVVRGYDVNTGALLWAWDAKRIDIPQQPLAEGELWPRGTPNVWGVISADEELGLVYLPTGNAANDHFGGDREPEDDEYTAAVVAVDAETGETVWHYRTLDHDLWDYDLGAQPVVMDLDIDGETVRAVVQATKQGSTYVLDAATGEPLRPVELAPAPQGAVEGDWVAEAQPQSVFYPNLAGRPGQDPEEIDASYAFGLTPLDALYCRIEFARMRYEGIYTPPTDEGLGMLLFPGTIGGPNWGGISVNLDQQVMVTNHSRLPNRVQLFPRAEVDDLPLGEGEQNRPDQEIAPQGGAPYGVDRPIWLSPLGVPCISPPWGYLAATDLRTGDLLWAQPLGTGYDTGPLGIPSRLKLTIGTANIGGAVSTRTGLTFIAAAQDNFLRAFDTYTGDLLWEARLPASAQAGPISYVHEGRQYVAIAAGGHTQLETTLGDSVVVFALP